MSTLSVTCLTNGQYDKNIKDYTCLSKLDSKYGVHYNKIISLDHGWEFLRSESHIKKMGPECLEQARTAKLQFKIRYVHRMLR